MLTKKMVVDILETHALSEELSSTLFDAVASAIVKASKRAKKAAHPCYSDCMKVYDTWHKERFGVPPKIDYLQGRGLHSIILYLSAIDSVKSGAHTVLDSFRAILNNWNKLDNFSQKRTKLSDISSDISKIIIQIKQNRNGGTNLTESELNNAINNEARKRT